MSGPSAAPEPWLLLDLPATVADPAEVRRAYARALRAADPEQDPERFAALRNARDALLRRLDAARDDDPPGDPPDELAAGAAVAAFLDRLRRLRQAGDVPGAIAAVDRLIDGSRLGSSLLAMAADALFRTMALDRRLAPDLFRHLVERLDWRDAAGPAAASDPRRYAALAQRIAAEDWHAALLHTAAAPDESPARTVARLALARNAPPRPIADPDQVTRDAARSLVDTLLRWESMLLDRFDARSLAALRETAEGPPLAAAPPMPVRPAPSPVRPPATAPVRRAPAWSRRGRPFTPAVALAVGLSLVAIKVVTGFGDPPAPLPAASARSEIDRYDRWAFFERSDDGFRVSFRLLVENRAALRDVRYGLDRPLPDQDFPLPPGAGTWPQPIDAGTRTEIKVPATIRFVTVQLVYANGDTSAPRVFVPDADRP